MSRPRLAGPTALLTLTTYLEPEGSISHYEIIGRTIEGAQTYFRAQGSHAPFPSDSSFVETVAHLAQVIQQASEDLVNVYGLQQTIEDAPHRGEGRP